MSKYALYCGRTQPRRFEFSGEDGDYLKLTYYSYAPFDVPTGRITVLDTGALNIYHDLVRGLRNDEETLHVATDEYDLKEVNQLCRWYGDPLLELDLNAVFQRKLQVQLLKVLSDQQTVQLTDQVQQLLTQILGDSYVLDVPLGIPETPELAKLMKFSGLKIDGIADMGIHGILETLIKVLVELNDRHTVVLTNVSHYLQVAQFKLLSKAVADAGLPLLIIEFSEIRRQQVFEDCDYHYIDSDFVLW
ncbi:type II-A CRISPR-associated protein Csn2 [Levilactobacillus zymae]|nr:type II-A CRISPR-associated protein Csn2 [Levilactobacillus zymae]